MKTVCAILFLQCLALLSSSQFSSANPEEVIVIDKREAPAKKNSETCGKNELFNACSPTCERICSDFNNDNRAGDRCVGKNDCVQKCICKDGYVREKIGGNCIRIQECPRVKH